MMLIDDDGDGGDDDGDEGGKTLRRESHRKSRHDTDAGLIPRCGKNFFVLPESKISADSLNVFAWPLCAVACINSFAHVKNPKHWQPYHWTQGNTAHTGRNG